MAAEAHRWIASIAEDRSRRNRWAGQPGSSPASEGTGPNSVYGRITQSGAKTKQRPRPGFPSRGLYSWRGQDLNLRPPGYEPGELPNCSTPRRYINHRRWGDFEANPSGVALLTYPAGRHLSLADSRRLTVPGCHRPEPRHPVLRRRVHRSVQVHRSTRPAPWLRAQGRSAVWSARRRTCRSRHRQGPSDPP